MLVLRAIQGPDGHDSTIKAAPLGWNPRREISTLRIGVAREEFETVADDRRPLLASALDNLRSVGARLQDVKLPTFAGLGATRIILDAEESASFDDAIRSGSLDRMTDARADAPQNVFRAGRLVPAVEYLRAMSVRTLLMREMRALMSQYDAIVTHNTGRLQGVTNLTGHPVISVPCGVARGQNGLQFVGRLFDEGVIARIASAYQDATEWHRRIPPGF
jgi:Asp-tRNA(Asn)/Glu-tRNA(Gln) amidotransferase A subunit family amidase